MNPKSGPENRCKVGELCLEVPPDPNPYSIYACWESTADCPPPTNTPVPPPSNTPHPGPSNTPHPSPTGNPPPTATCPVPTTPTGQGQICSSSDPTSPGCYDRTVGYRCLDPDYYCKMLILKITTAYVPGTIHNIAYLAKLSYTIVCLKDKDWQDFDGK